MSAELLTSLLRDVSRSFYLTMRILPGAIRPQISVAYLLARATDTIADTELVSVAIRLESLSALRERILGASAAPLNFGLLAQGNALPGERILLERIEEVLRLLEQFSEADRARIRDVLRIIISGQELDLRRFGDSKPGTLIALETEEELDDYTYRVAGCVGEFWTQLCRAHLFPQASLDDELLLRNGIRFGKGLQWVNILRDIPRDLRLGRCYMPRQSLAALGLSPNDLLSADTQLRFRPLYDEYLNQAEGHLAAGWDYTNALPPGQARLRLACAWPILIGARTIQQLRQGNVLDGSRRLKVGRRAVYAMMGRSVLLLAWPAGWRSQFRHE
ncbi:MAG TPA: phytoene/squalene synthase family protein [Candidatus Saccharimonadales bacterium]|nr:phytoene/squalene synthase family protein [Candidatus Saccharimonadales bacterium]